MKTLIFTLSLIAQSALAATMPEDVRKFAAPLTAVVGFIKTPSNSMPTDSPSQQLITSMLNEYQEAVHGKNSVYALGVSDQAHTIEFVDSMLKVLFSDNFGEKSNFAHAQLDFLKKAHSIMFGSDGNEEDVLLILSFRAGGIFRVKFPMPGPPTDPNPCTDLNGNVPQFCIMRADRFHVEDPFIKHRSCGITEHAVIEVNIDNHVVQKTVTPISDSTLATLQSKFNLVQGIAAPPFSTDRLINYWKVLNPGANAPTDRALLATKHVDDQGLILTDAQSTSLDAQALIGLLDSACPPTEN